MKWKKLGLIFRQKGDVDWQASSALTPTPFLLDNATLRVYAGFRDPEGISRIGYVDLETTNPCQIKKVSKQPVLATGRDGCFDDNGVILGDVVRHGNVLRMYYVGFQQVKRAKFLAFTGLAESEDQGETFQRVSEAPIMDRTNHATTIRTIHSVIYEEGRWKVWYAAGDDWEIINGEPYPKYNIWYTESPDGVSFPHQGTLCVDVSEEEYRIGRPSVYQHHGEYLMFYTKGTKNGKDYFPGLARSKDGINWKRTDEELGLTLSKEDFDSVHLCYPRLITVFDKIYCVYNGNNMGIDGFGMAELLEW